MLLDFACNFVPRTTEYSLRAQKQRNRRKKARPSLSGLRALGSGEGFTGSRSTWASGECAQSYSESETKRAKA